MHLSFTTTIIWNILPICFTLYFVHRNSLYIPNWKLIFNVNLNHNHLPLLGQIVFWLNRVNLNCIKLKPFSNVRNIIWISKQCHKRNTVKLIHNFVIKNYLVFCLNMFVILPKHKLLENSIFFSLHIRVYRPKIFSQKKKKLRKIIWQLLLWGNLSNI